MPRLDNLFQFIVPLTFLAIWALTSLLNREAQPLPPRAGRPKPPNGPGSGPGASANAFRAETIQRDPNARWASPAAGERPAPGVRRPPGRPVEEIVIIEETRRPVPPGQSPGVAPSLTRPGVGTGARRGNRARPAPSSPTPTRRPEPQSLRPLSGAVGPSAPINAPMNKTLTLDPLSLPASPLLASDPRDLARTVAEPTRQAARPVAVWDDFRLLLSTPSKLREAIIVNEILQPPLSLRQRRPGA